MTLVRIADGDGGGGKVKLTACPLCGHEFAPSANRPYHFWSDHDAGDL